jgi:hypothetical protein
LAHEFSGSNDFLTFYDARDCKKIGEIDISNSVWRVGKLNISVTNQKAANNKKVLKPRMYSLTKYCTQKN